MSDGLTLTQDQTKQLSADTEQGTTNFVQGYYDILAFIKADDPNGTILSASTVYWYEHAPLVNNASGGSATKIFIDSVASFGELLDGKAADNTQQISDDIAGNVFRQILGSNTLPQLPALLGQDIGTAMNDFDLTIGGWGGSFYYWSETPILADGTVEQSVGSQITAQLASSTSFYDDGGQFDKFMATNGAAIANVDATAPGGALSSLWTGVQSLLGLGAEVPTTYGFALIGRAIDIGEGDAIVGDPNTIDGNIYIGGSWNQVVPSVLSFDAPPIPPQKSVH